ncbi:MAG: magnesium protoporphyrin IX methyltransferase [Roseitalea sp.]|jgi:magnesium-protoporphyrin O-methyltransferase|uniref:Magnesium protoporphyrin IX methyltransferase n=1 Tax=Oceaniradius stylonematis TaxID=2184161 RepID=A0A3A8AIQ1_9HYPH|nr:magnesium protoporphyrin IX methyltransferase [Oceaniradius stylonematis]MBO6551248.1 magnesium protoporphyrin IX methyltransferase [Roseitalea sp.]MBO6952372.1 magnesium protoporphyrin IX methyltransferase [Rhizobiaceae bacterium]MBO6591782.1 magnesium protoporphyrin IX methyltransferase [Roseitalea sp.]MBO6598037.1 magnesium protoporphyrin IX methyltransferase [Roseitalea sp.]MBO6610483.1 magnesium protoporphyrin IX methyltransferase [Roseitalea sp.]
MTTADVHSGTYAKRRGELEVYFDRTAVDGWKKLVTDEKVSRIRQTVREGRDRMRATLLSCLPDDLSGWRVLDAGCGSGVASFELARRGADVLGIDLSEQMVGFARDRLAEIERKEPVAGTARFVAGDMLSADHGRFDAVFAMDSLIHYRTDDAVAAIAALGQRTERAMVFTIAPRTPMLAAMHAIGQMFPRSDRSPGIEPVRPDRLSGMLEARDDMAGWRMGRTTRISSGFYISQAMEVRR